MTTAKSTQQYTHNNYSCGNKFHEKFLLKVTHLVAMLLSNIYF